jgi:hypothetical protein
MAKKGIELVREINAEWIKSLEEDDTLRILVYEPFTDEYWNEKYKIVWCNLEPGGEPENKDEKVLSLETYGKWLKRNNPTIRNTSLFIYCLYNKLLGNDIDEDQKNAAKKDYELLLSYMKKITYMNLLKDCGNGRFDKAARKYFNGFFYGEKGYIEQERTKKMIAALSPDIFIVTGDVGISLIQKVFNKKFDEKDRSFVDNNTLFVKMGHPAGCWHEKDWYRSYIYNGVNLINDNLTKYNLKK